MSGAGIGRPILATFSVAAVLFVVGGAVGYLGASAYREQFLAFSIAGLLLTLAFEARVALLSRSADARRVGEAGVQGAWVWTSLSLVYITMSPASVYGVEPWALAALEAVGVVMLLLGAYILLRIKRETGVYLSV